jgi:hypothetical protein
MFAMITFPTTSLRRLIIIPATSEHAPAPAPVRRFRIARLGFRPPPGDDRDRLSYLKRTHD